MEDVVGDACDPPFEGAVDAYDEEIGDGAQSTEEQPEESGEHTPEKWRLLSLEQESEQCEQRPGIKVHNPPEAEAVDAPLKQNKHRNYESNQLSDAECIQDNQ